MPECLYPEEKFGNEMIVVSEELLWLVDKKLWNGKVQQAPMGESNDNKREKLQSGALRLVPRWKTYENAYRIPFHSPNAIHRLLLLFCHRPPFLCFFGSYHAHGPFCRLPGGYVFWTVNRFQRRAGH